MRAYVFKLVQRLCEPSRPLSRNRHYHTFETEEGRQALRISRRLRSLAKDILAAAAEGHSPQLRWTDAEAVLHLEFHSLRGRRVATLSWDELELLMRMGEALKQVLAPLVPTPLRRKAAGAEGDDPGY